MKLRSKISAVLVTGALAGTAVVVAAGPAQAAVPVPNGSVCALQTDDKRYVTFVDGGDRATNVMRTDSFTIGRNEKFTLEGVGDGIHVDLRTYSTNYVTAVNSGGLTHNQVADVLHTNAWSRGTWETFQLLPQFDGTYGIKTFDGHVLTAVDGGGHATGAFDSNRTAVQSWEKFVLTCGLSF